MRKGRFLYVALALVLSAAVILAGCGKKDTGSGPELLEALNQNPFGLEFQVDSGDISATAEGDGQRVIFRDARYIFDTAILKETPMGENIKPGKVPIDIDEIAFLYRPKDDYLECLYVKGMKAKLDIAEMVRFPDSVSQKGTPEIDIGLAAATMEFGNYNISPMLTYGGDDLWEFAEEILNKNQSVTSEVKDITYRLNMKDVGKGGEEPEDVNMEFSVDAIDFSQKSVSAFFLKMYNKESGPVDLGALLKSGDPLIDMNSSMKGMEFSFSGTEDGEKVEGSGSIGNASASYHLKPNEEKTHFDLGLDYNLGGVTVDLPGEDTAEAEEIINGIKKLNLSFSLDNLSPELVMAYMDVTQKSMAMQGDPEKMKQNAAGSGQQLLGQLMQSQPALSLSINPLEHDLGMMELNADFSMPSMMTPDGRAVLKIYDIQSVLESVKKMKGFEEQEYNMFSQWVAMMLKTDEDGNGTMVFEMKEEEPGVRYLNGMKMN